MQQSATRVPTNWGVDGVGVLLSGLCLVHCAAPVVLPMCASLATCHDTCDRTHAGLAVVLPAVALFAFQRGYATHGRAAPVLSGVLGVVLVIAGALPCGAFSETAELALTVVGSLLLAVGHLVNKRLLRRAGGCCP